MVKIKEEFKMKKFSIFAAAALMLAAVSCNKEAPIAEPEQGAPAVQKITFTAYADNGTDTRTILNGNDIKWAAGETIYVFDGTAPRAFTSTNTEEDAIVTFEGEAAVNSTYTAVSPAATMTGNTINATIPVFQTATADSFDPKANVSVAVANGGPDVDLNNLTLQFKNAGAVVKFKLTDADVAKVRLDAIGGEKLAGKASITLNGNIPSVTMASDAESCVILKPASGNFSTDATYAIAIAPGTYALGFKLTLFKADGKFKSFSNKNSQTLGRNKMMDFGTIPATTTNWKTPKVDVLTRVTTGIADNGGYGNWTANCESGASYKGNSGGAHDAIQLRSNNSNSGIVTTASAGNVVSISVEWEENTLDGRTLDIYGKSTAYESPEDLYNINKQGTKLGSIVCGSSTSLNVTGNYAYFGIRSNNNAMYLSSVTITWSGGGSVPVDPVIAPASFKVVSPSSTKIPAAGGSSSFTITSDAPWTLSLNDDTAATYTTSVSGNTTTVNVSMTEISSGSRSAVFTVTPFEGTAETVTFTQEVSREVSYSFAFSEIGTDGWGTSYTMHTLDKPEATVVLNNSSKQTTTITNYPVTKDGAVTVVLKSGTMTSVTFTLTQWTNKAKTVSLQYSTDGGSTYSAMSPAVSSSNFTLSAATLPAGTNAVKMVQENTSNQVGLTGVSFTLLP
jgi:hypothetical protein